MTDSAFAPRRRFRAPAFDGERLVTPSPADVAGLIAENRDRASRSLPLRDRETARADLLQAALAYTREYRDVDMTGPSSGPLFLSGHQPHVFHPGVWFKNFLLSEFGRVHRGLAINLIVDNDTLRQPTIAVPGGALAAPRIEHVPFDEPQREMPWEERSIVQGELFRSFLSRVRQTVRPLFKECGVSDSELVLDRLAPLLDNAAASGKIGRSFAQARHALEASWGLQTLEVPVSVVARQPAFRRFVLRLAAEAERLHGVYNPALADYRRANHLRSRSHPAPDLDRDGEWWELPLWIWTADDPVRKRLFVRRAESDCELTDRAGLRSRLPLGEAGAGALDDLERRGVKIRPRAFVTTMFARLWLSDLFVHGIGGAKYDEVTDRLIRGFLDMEPPEYLTATATFRLPCARERDFTTDLNALQIKRRRLQHHPELSVSATDAAAQALVGEKERLLAQTLARGERRARRQRIAAINEQLSARLGAEIARTEADLADVRESMRRQRLLGSREFSFLLFPAANLSRRLMDLSRRES